MPPRPRNRLGLALKKGLSSMLVTTLLVSQQGLSLHEAFAQTVEAGQSAAAAGSGGIGVAGAGVSLQGSPIASVQLSLGPQSLGAGMSVLPSVQSLSPSLSPVSSPGSVSAALPQAAGAPSISAQASPATAALSAPARAQAAAPAVAPAAAAGPGAAARAQAPAALALAPSAIPQAARPAASSREAGAPALSSQAGPAAAGKALDAARKGLSDSHGPQAQPAALDALFDGQRAAAPTEVQPGAIKAFLTRDGKDPVVTDLAALRQALGSDPGYAKSLNETGRVRLVLNEGNPDGGLKHSDLGKVRAILQDYGVTAKIEVENIPIDWARKQAQAKDGAGASQGRDDGLPEWRKSRWWRYVVGPVTAPFREIAYLSRTLAASLTWPTWSEVVGGIVSKAPGVVLGTIWWAKLFLPLHPAAFGAALAFTLALNVFHGIWINSWSNFQNNIGRQRGIGYQTFFNLFYMQATGAVFRLITWAVIAGTVPPWSLGYWRDIGIASVIGTFFGTLGFQGLNGLYDKGRVPRAGRSLIQQVRDICFTIAGPLFGSGSMAAYWVLFAFQQGLDIGIYAISRRLKSRPIVYVADEGIAGTGEFQGMYPVRPGERPSPLQQALDAVLNNPLVKPVVTLVKWVYRKLTQGGKGGKP